MRPGRAILLLCASAWPVGVASAAPPPTDNPAAAFYADDDGYPAWTDRIRWKRTIDMSAYPKGGTDFEKFESARDELAAAGGGVLYYPAGTYNFTKGPMDGPAGRGLMLPAGVVIRGETPPGRPVAFKAGKLELPTRFVFGFRKIPGGEIPRDWNVIGLRPAEDKGLHEVDDVGICWVHLTGAVIAFGPQVDWGPTWAEAKSWKSGHVVGDWQQRKPDGTHPLAPFVGGGRKYVGVGSGRIVLGCVVQDAAVDSGFLKAGHHPLQFCARIAVYGDRVLVANNLLPKSRKTFRYDLNGMKQLYDYGKPIGIDVNKNLLGLCRDEGRCPGYFEPGVAVLDNWVYNHANKGYEVAGSWATLRRNHNARDYLKSGSPKAYGIDGWVLTLDGVKKAGGASDNMSRAFDLGGGPLWIDGCTLINTGSDPGNDGEGILCQRHGGTEVYSWAITRNAHDRGEGEPGYFGGYDVHCYGLLIAWNRTPGWVGNAKAGRQYDCTFVPNECRKINVAQFAEYTGKVKGKHTGTPPVADILTEIPTKAPTPPADIAAALHEGDAVKITWRDTSDAELGFRVDRRIGPGDWRTVAYRPRRSEGHERNPAAWVDFLAPPGKPLTYRVVACDAKDTDRAASPSSAPVTIAPR
jgi:hypothetical protein